MASAGTPPFWPINKVSGFNLDNEGSNYLSDTPFSPSEPSSIQSISPTMLSAPMQIEHGHHGRSGLRSGFTASDQATPGVSREDTPQGYFSEDSHLPGSVPFSTSFMPIPQEYTSKPDNSQSKHAHSLSMPTFGPDAAKSLLMPPLATFTSQPEPDHSFYPNYVHESWSPSLTPATGKAPSSRSRSNRRSSLGSPHLAAEDMPKSHIPRNAEQRTGNLFRRTPMYSSSLTAPALASSVPSGSSDPRPRLEWMRDFNSERTPGVRHDSPALQDHPHPGSAPGSLNPISPLLQGERSAQSPEGGDGSPKMPSTTDKRKKRRESHNMVERRRRDGINAAIERLSELLPEMLLEPSGTGQTTHHLAKLQLRMASEDSAALGEASQSLLGGSVYGTPGQSNGVTTTTLKPNKAVVLSKTVEYVQHLQELVQIQARRNQVLEASLGAYSTRSQSSTRIHAEAASPVVAPPPLPGQLSYDEELFDMTSNMELA